MATAPGDADFNGLQVVWKGRPDTRIAADVVAVHGLAAGSSSTYCHENGCNLLGDLLAHDADLRNIRILTFGYAASDAYYINSVDEPRSTGRLMTFAEQLCQDLRNRRADLNGPEKHRPIIFIAHGVGGLIVKRALVDHKDILLRTNHVLFFDTPHQGFDTRAWSILTGRNLTEEAEKQFASGSTSLSELVRSFREICGANQNLRFSSFYSALPSATPDGECMPISESSAILGIGFERCTQLDRKSHLFMLQYPDSRDPMYRRIKMCLREVLLRLPRQGLDNELVLRSGGKELQRYWNLPLETLTWLSSYDHEFNQQRFSAMRLPNTADWILTNSTFAEWFQSTRSSCLWCSGKIGSGKTIICSRVIQKTRASFLTATNVAVIYVFCQYDSPGTSSTSSIVSSLVKQLLLQLKATGQLNESTIEDNLEAAHRQGRSKLSTSEAYEILISLAGEFSTIFVILDGVDALNSSKENGNESSDEAASLLRVVRKLLMGSVDTTIKFFVSSRFQVDDKRFIQSSLHISLSETNVQPDIRTFVDEEVEDRIWAAGRTDDRGLIQEIKEKLTSEAQGMFLWAKLQVQALCEDCNSDSMLREALSKLPPSLHEIYRRCLLRIIRRQGDLLCAPKVLKWVSFAKRPLHADELKEAIHIQDGDTRWDESKSRMTTSVLINSCGGLVDLDEFDLSIRLIHSSVKEYLSLGKASRDMDPFTFDCTSANLELGQACLTYLTFQDFSTQTSLRSEIITSHQISLPGPQEIIENAASPWISDIIKLAYGNRRRSPAPITIQSESSRRSAIPAHFLNKYRLLNYACSFWALHTKYIAKSSPLYPVFLRLATQPNSTWMLQPWLRKASVHLYAEDLFEWAINNEHTPLLSAMVEINKKFHVSSLASKILKNGKSAMHHAAAEGLVTIVEFFLSVVSSPHPLLQTDADGCTPLHSAASHSQAGTAHTMMRYAVKPPFSLNHSKDKWLNARSKEGATALFKAVECGSLEIVRLLLSHSASFKHEKPTSSGATVIPLLCCAARSDHFLVVRELLYLEDAASYVPGALVIAAGEGYIASATELLDWATRYGCDPDPNDEAVRITVDNNRQEVLSTLLSFRDIKQLKKLVTLEYLSALIAEGKSPLTLDTFLGCKACGFVLPESILLSLLHFAIGKVGSAGYIKVLLKHGANVNGKLENKSPLFAAVAANDIMAVRVLLDRGADRTAHLNGETTAGRAVSKGMEPVLRILLESGVDANQKSLFYNQAHEITSLLDGAILSQRPAIIKTLLEFGASREARNGVTAPVLSAIKVGDPDIVAILLESGASGRSLEVLEAVYNKNALGHLDFKPWLAIIRHLLRHGLKMNERYGRKSRSILMSTVMHTNSTWPQSDWELIIKALLERGAEVNELDSDKKTPLDLAVSEHAKNALKAAGAKTGSEIQADISRSYFIGSLSLIFLFSCYYSPFVAICCIGVLMATITRDSYYKGEILESILSGFVSFILFFIPLLIWLLYWYSTFVVPCIIVVIFIFALSTKGSK